MPNSRFSRFKGLSRLFDSFKSAGSTRRVMSLVTPAWGYGRRPDYFERNFENYVKEGYRRNALVYACITKTANTAASVSLQMHDKGTDQVLKDHPVRQILTAPNPLMDEFDFWTTTIVHMKLAGVSYWQKIRDNAGIMALWPIRPDYVRPQIDQQSGLTSYRIHISGIDVDDLPAQDVMAFRLPDPMDMFKVMSPIEVLSRDADVDNSLTDFLKIFMDRGAVPQGVLKSSLVLNDDEVEDVRARWEARYGGYRNWMSPAVLDKDAEYQTIGMSFDEMEFGSLDGRNEQRICMVLDTPPIIIGTGTGLDRSTFSNYESAYKLWWETSLMAIYVRLSSVINRQLVPEFDSNIEAQWDFTKVPALQEARDSRWTRATAAFSAGVITRNMALEEMGLETVGAEGDVFVQSIAVTEVRDNPADNRPPESQLPDSDESKSAPIEIKAIVGTALPVEIEADVKPFEQQEKDEFFELYRKVKAKKTEEVAYAV
jgi:HK97 family phage portal protein